MFSARTFLSALLASVAFTQGLVQTPDGGTWGLKDAYKGAFKIGFSTQANRVFQNAPGSDIIKANAEVLLTETDLIWSSVEVQDGQYFWGDVDEYLDWADANGIEPIGHCLIWKGIGWMSSHPPNMSDADLQNLYLSRMQDYIKTVLGRYKDRIKRWVVVNEWFNLDAQIRQDWPYIKTLGLRGVEAAYTWAKQYGSPDNIFYHSENGLGSWEKTKGVSRYLRSLRAKGLKIDGIFFQGHQWHNQGPVTDALGAHTHVAVADMERSIKHWGKTGFKVVMSELDITVLPDGWDCCRNTSLAEYPLDQQAGMNPFANGMDLTTAKQQRAKWTEMFKMLLRQKDIITDVHMWGVSDKDSWYNKWPIRGRTDYPCLFNRQYEAKPQYYDLLRMAPNQPPAGTVIPLLRTSTT